MPRPTVEEEVKKRLEDVTKKLNRREAELQFARSEEGKLLANQIKQAENKLKLEEKSLETKDQISLVEAEIIEAQKELAASREVEHDTLVRREKALAKIREKQRKKAAADERKYFKELLSSLNPFKMLGKAMGSFIPKPIKILGSWGAHLSKRWGGRLLRGMGRMAMKGGRAGVKGIASVIRGKSPVEAEAEPETIPETKAIPRKTTKLDPKAYLLTSKTQPLYEDGETPETVPEEGILGKAKTGAGKFVGGIGGAVDKMFAEPEAAPEAAAGETIDSPQDGFGLLHTDLVGIHGLLEEFVGEATTKGSIFVHDKAVEEATEKTTEGVQKQGLTLQGVASAASDVGKAGLKGVVSAAGDMGKAGLKGAGNLAKSGLRGAGRLALGGAKAAGMAGLRGAGSLAVGGAKLAGRGVVAGAKGAGSMFTGGVDKVQEGLLGIEEKLSDQTGELTGELEEQTTDLEPETIDASVEREGDIEAKVPGGSGVGAGKGKKKGGTGSKILGGLAAGLGLPAWATDPAMMAQMVGGGAKAGMGKLWSGASKAFSNPKFAKIMGPAAIAGGIALMVKDGMAGVEKSEEWGVSKVSGAMGGILGGVDKGFKGAMANMGKWALIGAGIGSIVPVIGTLVGGLIGAVVGAILGWIGGERIAKFFSGVGAWVSEKWNTIKEFPGKIWDAIINTVKGWLGFGGGEETVPVEKGKGPEKGWLSTIIGFIIPLWLIDFAKDAVGTVLGWLGLTKKDADTGETTTTDMGKKVFGTIGAIGDMFMTIVKAIVPQGVIDFVSNPLGTIMGWLGLTETDEEGATTTTDTGKKVFAVIGSVGDLFMNIVKKIIPQGLIDFVKSPIDSILKMIGWKTDTGETTDQAVADLAVLEEGSAKDKLSLFGDIIKRMLPDALVKLIELGPVEWILQKIGWKSAEGEATEAGKEAVTVLKEGSVKDKAALFGAIIKNMLPESLQKLIELGPVEWFLQKIGWKSDTGETTAAGGEAAEILKEGSIKDKAALAAGVIGKLIPDSLKKIWEMGLVDWFLWKIGWKDEAGGATEKGMESVKKMGSFRDAIMGKIKGMVAAVIGKLPELIVPDSVLIWAGLKPSKEQEAAQGRVAERGEKLTKTTAALEGRGAAGIAERKDIEAAAKKKRSGIDTDLEKMREKLRQSELYFSSGGKEGDYLQSMVGSKTQADEDSHQQKLRDEILAKEKELTGLNTQEQTDLAQSSANEEAEIKGLTEQQVQLQTEQTADNKLLASLVHQSVPHIKVMSLEDPADMGATAKILAAGAGGGSNAVVVNNVTNSTGGSTSAPTAVTNMNIMAGANDPHTSKQPNHMFGNY